MAVAVAARQRLCGRWNIWLPGLTQVRWTRYNPMYVEPLLNKDVYHKPLEEKTEKEKTLWNLRTTRPVKAAPSNVSSSVFNDPVIRKFTSIIMKGGDKLLARNLINETLELIKRKQFKKYHEATEEEKEGIELSPYRIFHQALRNCEPVIGIVRVIKAGKTYQVPAPVTARHKQFLAMKWMVTECRENRDKHNVLFPEKLSSELIEAFNNEGPVIKKKHELHKMAESNRAFAHYRWL